MKKFWVYRWVNEQLSSNELLPFIFESYMEVLPETFIARAEAQEYARKRGSEYDIL
jgi:hypothetical protein